MYVTVQNGKHIDKKSSQIGKLITKQFPSRLLNAQSEKPLNFVPFHVMFNLRPSSYLRRKSNSLINKKG